MSKHICDEEFPWCTATASKGELYKLRLKDLSPTQFALGRAEVEFRAAALQKKYKSDPGRLHDYLRVRPVPIVIRENTFYLVDHHHLVRALHDALHKSLGDEICVYVEVLTNISSLGHLYFWKQMYAHNWVYLFDHEGGGPQPPDKLPTHIRDMKFDPYRSLAWIVRDRYGYLKSDADFAEFRWADYFRTRILLDSHILGGEYDIDGYLYALNKDGEVVLTEEGKEVIDEAMFLATSPEARGLPGFRGNRV
ncbi:MAG: ParB-like protein [Gammaproteobacteria bacterium]|jgi:hypothetical protein